MKPRLLSDREAKGSLLARMAKTVDRLRHVNVRLGARPYQVFLCWITWDGPERGEGRQKVTHRCPVLPVPKVEDLSLRYNPSSGGKYPAGSVRVTEVTATYKLEFLTGKVVPDRPEDEVPHPYEFFYEIVEDGRHGPNPERKRFVLAATPQLDAEHQQWILVLEKQSGDMKPDGTPGGEQPDPTPDPWRTRKIEAPEDDF